MTELEIQNEELMRENAFMIYNHVELESVEMDHAVYQLNIRPESKNPYGMVHGGALYTLADDTAGAAAHSTGLYYVTQNGNLHFIKNQGVGSIWAEGRVRHRGRTTCLTVVDITNEKGELLATGEFSYFCVDRDLMEEKAKQADKARG